MCDPATGGRYYDADPNMGGTPTKSINDADPNMGGTPTKSIMCPATCDVFGLGGKIDILLGCETVIPG